MKRKWKIGVAAVCAALLVTAAYAATAGSQNDPLVTLGYLTGVFQPKVQETVEDAVTEREDALQQEMEQAIQNWDKQVQAAMDGEGSGNGAGAVFQVVTLEEGQTLVGDVGCEMMLRIGTGVCISDGTPGLIDVSAGTTLNDGQELETNHLYMVTISTRSVQVVSDTAKIMVRGPYSISG